MTRNVVQLYAAPPADGVDELAALRAELTEQCRLNGMGQQREARLMAQLQEAERKLAEAERNALERALETVDELLQAETISKHADKSFCFIARDALARAKTAIRALMNEGGE
jgi:flavin-binding protein dodecin